MSFAYSDDFLAELMAAFSTEAAEQLQALNEGLLALERDEVPEGEAKAELLREIFRNAHTLKGGAAAVDLPDVRELAHHLESLFALLQSGDFQPEPTDYDVLYRSLDGIEALVEQAKGGAEADVDLPALISEVEALGGRSAPAGPAAAASAPAPDTSETSRAGESLGPADQAEPPTSGTPGPPGGDSTGPSDEVVRIPISKLDALMSEVGELMVARNATGRDLVDLKEVAKDAALLQDAWRQVRPAAGRGSLEAPSPALETMEEDLGQVLTRIQAAMGSLSASSRRADQITAVLHDDMRAARMLPLQSILAGFPRMVRDLARQQGKEVNLDITGAETELDRAVLEQIKAPLVHLLRNCVDHGLEEPALRRSADKPDEGTISLSAAQYGETVRLEIGDDGRGIDPVRVRSSAVAKGVLTADEADSLGRAETFRLIFRSGLSTSTIITDVSGRGVGLDVVRQNVERLGGSIEVESDTGRGTRFRLALPLTVVITRCLLVRSGPQRLAVPINNIVRVLRVAEGDIYEVDGGRALKVDDKPVILAELANELRLVPDEERSTSRPALLIRSGDDPVALAVDEVENVQDLVVKALPQPLAGTPNLTGAALLDTGEVVLVLNVADMARSSRSSTARRAEPATSSDIDQEDELQKVILLADDSLTTRTLEKNILQAAGYIVNAAADGQDAWDLLHAEGADLVVSDVQMPRMDGFELTERIRKDARFQDLPVVLVTSLDSPADRRRGIEAGADAYIVKSGFDQEHLIDVIRRLV